MRRKFVQLSKNDDLVEVVELMHAIPMYAQIQYSDGCESSVPLSDLAPCSWDNEMVYVPQH